jgi:hypothetical protein
VSRLLAKSQVLITVPVIVLQQLPAQPEGTEDIDVPDGPILLHTCFTAKYAQLRTCLPD